LAAKDQQLYLSIKNGEESGLVELYKLHRQEFINWVWQQYKMESDDAADVFQDTIITLRRNIVKGKLVELTSSLKTYLFAIGRNLALSRLKQNKKWYTNPDILELEEDGQESITATLELNERQVWVKTLIAKLGEPCVSILRLYYYKSYSMEAIASTLGYKNENVVKSQKLRCIKALKTQTSQKENS